MQKCTKCNVSKSDEGFSWRLRNKTRKLQCKQCDKEYRKNHYWANRDYWLKKSKRVNKNLLKRNRDYVYDYLLSHPCVDCGETNPIVLEFDHLCPRNKTASVFEFMRKFFAIGRIQEEIDKCAIRCANCHKIRSAQQFGYWRFKRVNNGGSDV